MSFSYLYLEKYFGKILCVLFSFKFSSKCSLIDLSNTRVILHQAVKIEINVMRHRESFGKQKREGGFAEGTTFLNGKTMKNKHKKDQSLSYKFCMWSRIF